MSDFQLKAIVKIITNGAPALAEELCKALDDVLMANRNIRLELDSLKATLKADKETADTADLSI